jgi:ribosomal protein S27AE
MIYACELGMGQSVYLEERNDSTIVTTVNSGFGQQQQSSTSFVTGEWIAPPEMYQTPHGVILKIITDRGQHYIEIQENDRCLLYKNPANNDYHQIPIERVASIPSFSMPPMQPMQPMQMGNMSMSANPMEMRMGNMVLQMQNSGRTTTKQSFCSQCGVKVKEDDRFCSSCGHALG